MRTVGDLWNGVLQSSSSSLVCFVLAFIALVIIGAGGVEEVLPGGGLNPYNASNVEKNHIPIRVAAYIAAYGVVVSLFALGSWLR